MITYIPLSMRPGHSTAKMQLYLARLADKTRRYEDGIIGRVDQDRRNKAVRAALAGVRRGKRGEVADVVVCGLALYAPPPY